MQIVNAQITLKTDTVHTINIADIYSIYKVKYTVCVGRHQANISASKPVVSPVTGLDLS